MMRTGWKLAALTFGLIATGAVALARQGATAGVCQVDQEREKVNRIPILDPIPGDSDTPCRLDPPGEDEVLAKVPSVDKTWRGNVRVLIEKIGDKVDPCKVYPLAGPCQLIHCHYKCTVSFDENSRSEDPIPIHHSVHRVEVVYIDKDYLRRCGPKPDRAEVPTPAPDLEHRMAEVEKKLDRILELLEDQKRATHD